MRSRPTGRVLDTVVRVRAVAGDRPSRCVMDQWVRVADADVMGIDPGASRADLRRPGDLADSGHRRHHAVHIRARER